jgi:hypothetical protein
MTRGLFEISTHGFTTTCGKPELEGFPLKRLSASTHDRRSIPWLPGHEIPWRQALG